MKTVVERLSRSYCLWNLWRGKLLPEYYGKLRERISVGNSAISNWRCHYVSLTREYEVHLKSFISSTDISNSIFGALENSCFFQITGIIRKIISYMVQSEWYLYRSTCSRSTTPTKYFFPMAQGFK
jgi:hypothetical protein